MTDPASPPSTASSCLRLVLAAIAGAATFIIVTVAAATIAGTGTGVSYFLSAATSGAMAGLVVAACMQRWRVFAAALVVIVLEVVVTGGQAVMMGAGDYRPPTSMFTGAIWGIIAAIALAVLYDAAARAHREPAVILPAVFAFIIVWVWAAMSGEDQIAKVKREAIPAIERLLSTDILASVGPITWEAPQWRTWSSGETNILTIGHSADPPVGIAAYITPVKASTPGRTSGFVLKGEGLSLRLPVKHSAKDNAGPEVYRDILRETSLKPELVDRFCPMESGKLTVVRQITVRGMTFNFSTNQWGDTVPGQPLGDYVHMWCTGTLPAP